MKTIIVSIIMPIFNEEKYLNECIDSLLLQDYPQDLMEWVFVDGMSKDKTLDILHDYQQDYPNLIRVFKNQNRTVPYAMNIGIREAKGKYIIRLDAHAEYSDDYISKCVYYLNRYPEIDNVGGIAITKSRTKIGSYIARLLSSKFGVGNSRFRTSQESGYVDTVPFGAFRRELFHEIGLYNEKLTRNEDNELNYRIRKNGGKIYLANDIKFAYYCRDNISGLLRMGFENGKWNILASYAMPGSMGLRHFIPMFFVLTLIMLITFSLKCKLALCLLIILLLLYFSINIFNSAKYSDSIQSFIIMIYLYFSFHVSYGFGSVVGILSLPTFRQK